MIDLSLSLLSTDCYLPCSAADEKTSPHMQISILALVRRNEIFVIDRRTMGSWSYWSVTKA